MIRRFEGDDGNARLLAALLEQKLVGHDAEVAAALRAALTLDQHEKGDLVIRQGATDNHTCLVLAGSVVVEVNGRVVATRTHGQHVGEMSTIDPSAPRSATVTAREITVVARIAERDFARIADRHPTVWRRLAMELGGRLRQRGTMLRAPNEQPVVFIGSSSEGLAIARAAESACQLDPWIVKAWHAGVFVAGATPIESLVNILPGLDFGLLVVTADDVTESRGATSASPRDNVIFELGLLMGALGRDRTFMLRPRELRDLKLPSDLIGVQPLEIVPGAEVDIAARIAPPMKELRGIVARLGPR